MWEGNTQEFVILALQLDLSFLIHPSCLMAGL